MREIEILTKRAADIPTDAEAWYGLGVLLLESSLAEWDVAAVAAAADALSQSLRLGRTSPWTCAALGYVEDMSGDANLALQHFADARKLDPAEPLHEIYALSLLIDSGAEVEALAGIEAAASRHQVDLEALRRDLASVGFPVTAEALLANGFIHPRNHFLSWLQDEADEVRKKSAPESHTRRAQAEATRCHDDQIRLDAAFDPAQVPESSRKLAPWARRLGAGDDICRRLLFERLSPTEARELVETVRAHAGTAHAWLDTFGQDAMTPEAAAVMFLLLGVEEELHGGPAGPTHGG
jgi:hypothetical protein